MFYFRFGTWPPRLLFVEYILWNKIFAEVFFYMNLLLQLFLKYLKSKKGYANSILTFWNAGKKVFWR